MLKVEGSSSTYDVYTRNDVVRVVAKADSAVIDKEDDEYLPSSELGSDLKNSRII